MITATLQILFLGAPLLLVALAQGLCLKYDLFSIKLPLDLGKSFHGKRIFGDNKTYRGFIINMVFCTLGTMIQAGMQDRGLIPPWLPLLDYVTNWPLIGPLIGMGMTAGELPNSFLKRQLDISPGKKGSGIAGLVFSLLDQVDLTIGIWVFIYLLVRPSLGLVLWSLLLTILLHVGVSTVGYFLGMRKTIV